MATEESKQFFCWGEIVREIYVSRAGDPVHAGDKALTLPRKGGGLTSMGQTDGQDKNNMSPHQSGGRHNIKN